MAPKQNLQLELLVDQGPAPSGTPFLSNDLELPAPVPTVPAATAGTKKKRITVVHCWTAPRSRSTALLYSFEARGDCCVAIDEPLKREWLVYHGDRVYRPYKANLIAGVPLSITGEDISNNPHEIYRWQREQLSLGERIHLAAQKLAKSTNDDDEGGVIFCKYMSKTHFLYNFDNDNMDDSFPVIEGVEIVHKHMFLVRDPVAILRSWDVLSEVHGDSCSAEEVGIVPLISIFAKVQQRQPNAKITILDSDALVADPVGVLKNICHQLDIPYKPSMMTWKAGPHECDACHAPWWYEDAHKSSGWIINHELEKRKSKPTAAVKPVSPKLLPVLEESLPAYQMLVRLNQTRNPTSSTSSAVAHHHEDNECAMVMMTVSSN